MRILTGKSAKPRRIMLYGVHGVGKSTWASQAPSPLFLDIEDGIGDIDVKKTEHLQSFDAVYTALQWLYSNSDDYETIVIDSLDWLERLIFDKVVQQKNETSKADLRTIEDIGYGAGYKMAAKEWERTLTALDHLRKDKCKTVVLLAHCVAKTFHPPNAESYERYEPALHVIGSRVVQEWCDEVLFAQFRVITRKVEEKFQRERNIAVNSTERYIVTSESSSVVAKNRLGLPPELARDWKDYAKHVQPKGNISGVVVDGSSKKK